MNKKFAEVFQSYGLEIQNNNAYGSINGYETNAFVKTSAIDAYPVEIGISFFASDAQKKQIYADLKNLGIKFFMFEPAEYGVKMGFNGMTAGSLQKSLPEHLDRIFHIIKACGALGEEYCPICGNAFNDSKTTFARIDNFKIKIGKDCINELNAAIEKANQEFDEAPNNYVRGFGGAVLGGLVGMIAAFAFYFIGFVSALSSLVAVALGAYLYGKFGGKQNKLMIVIVSTTTLIMMLLATFGVYYVSAAIEGATYNLSAGEAFAMCMEFKEFSDALTYDLILTLVFSIVGIVIQIFALVKKIKRKKTI